MRWFSTRSQSRGQGMVEFALVLPIFLAITLGTIEMGWLLYHNHTLSNATREGARYAMVNGSMSGPPATAGEVQSVVRERSGWLSGQINVELVEWNPGPPTPGNPSPDATDPGGTVTVRAAYNYQPIVGMVIGSGTIRLTSESTVIIQY
jgi:Flp pilus assembly protein TadG